MFIKVKTSELEGVVLDWAVMKARGDSFTDEVFNDEMRLFKYHHSMTGRARYSSNWAVGGPIIERERLDIYECCEGGWKSEAPWNGTKFAKCRGNTPLIAAMRCYVASKMGDTVEIPEELVKC